MRAIRNATIAFAAVAALAGPAVAQATKTVGGAPMFASKTIVDNAVNSKDHTTLVTAVKAAGLVETLQGAGPFTVFAPTNAAFAKLPAGTVETLVQPQSKAMLTSVLTYHVVPGRYTDKDLMALAKKSGGEAELKTVQGASLGVISKGGRVFVADNKGNTARVTIADVMQSNGVIHVIDKVVMP
ncbi:MAG TPA: fasciclin domain-containing protein [Beijerinckiaceae bacterium]|nr:fasciclin domain-containing protein [Beijerinckiaceae bacterium]